MDTKDKIKRRKRILNSLKTWEKEEKLKLIDEIKATLDDLKKDDDFFKLAGKWRDSRTAEEISQEIENSRTLSRKIDDL